MTNGEPAIITRTIENPVKIPPFALYFLTTATLALGMPVGIAYAKHGVRAVAENGTLIGVFLVVGGILCVLYAYSRSRLPSR